MGSAERTRAFLLRSVDFGEADRIVTLFTETVGKVSVMARGARSSRRRFGGALEPFSLIDVEVAPGRGQLDRLSAARIERPFVRLLGRLTHMREGGYALEAIRALLPERQPEPRLFTALIDFIGALDAPECATPRQLKLGLLVQAIAVMGFAPQLDRCGVCKRAPTHEQAVQLHPARGYIVCRACGGARVLLSGRTRALWSGLTSEGWLLAASTPWPDQQVAQVSDALKPLLECNLERSVSFV